MKQQDYIIRIDAERVLVQHRVPLSKSGLLFAAMLYLLYALILDTHRTGFFTLIYLLIPVGIGFSLIRAFSGEVMRCDAKQLLVAQRRQWGRWHRFHFNCSDIRELRRDIRNAGKSSYATLTFRYGSITFDLLENLSLTDATRILEACKSFGVDTKLPDITGAAMLMDIEKRGWLINPFKPDPPR